MTEPFGQTLGGLMDGDPYLETERQSGLESIEKPARKPAKRGPPKAILFVAALVLIGLGTGYWYWSSLSESTDDAEIDGSVHVIAPEVAGRVLNIAVEDNQHVAAGQLLVQIDPRDYQVKLDQAQAQLATARAQVADATAQLALRRASRDQAEATVRVEEANAVQAQQDFQRYKTIDPRAITRQQLDQATAAMKGAQARLDADRHAVEAATAQVSQAEAAVQSGQAAVASAQAAVDNAKLQLSYTQVTAPVSGYVGQKKVELGNYLAAGTVLMDVIADDMWVTANFKETQLAKMTPGKKVTIEVDAYPGVTFQGHVDSIQRGTGSVFSTLPAENATGNYVKVVQRVPVKILFDDLDQSKYRLSIGMSVVPTISLR